MRDITDAIRTDFESLPDGYWSFKDADTKELTHGIHSYPAMMVSPISRAIIAMAESHGDPQSVLDPFCGSGTVLVEAMSAGIPRIAGNDMNPLALLIARVKTTPIDPVALSQAADGLLASYAAALASCSTAIDGAAAYLRAHGHDASSREWGKVGATELAAYADAVGFPYHVPSFKNIGYWFRPEVVMELAALRSLIDGIGDPRIRDFMLVAMSDAIRFVSNRKNGEFKLVRMPASKLEGFRPDTYGIFSRILSRNVSAMRSFFNRMIEVCGTGHAGSHPACAGASPSGSACADGGASRDDAVLGACAAFPRADVCEGDARTLDAVPDGAYDLVITSPPYGDSRTTVAYGQYSRLSLQWIGLDDGEAMGIDGKLMGGGKPSGEVPGSKLLAGALEAIRARDPKRADEVLSFYADLDSALAAASSRTAANGMQFWVVGNRTVKGIVMPTDAIIAELAGSHGMEHVTTATRGIPNKVMPSRNSPSNVSGETGATMTGEHIVVLARR